MKVYMGTRFSDPLWFYLILEEQYATEMSYGIPPGAGFQDPEAMTDAAVAAYVANTVVYYSCVSCTSHNIGN